MVEARVDMVILETGLAPQPDADRIGGYSLSYLRGKLNGPGLIPGMSEIPSFRVSVLDKSA